MDSATINHFKIPNIGWITITENHITGGISAISKEIHFTISYHQNSEYVNFHLTKNAQSGGKPKIEIFRIAKDDLTKLADPFLIRLIKFFTKKTKINRRKFKHFTAIDVKSLENHDSTSILQRELNRSIKAKRTRAEYVGNFEEDLSSLSHSQELSQLVLDSIVNPKITPVSNVSKQFILLNGRNHFWGMYFGGDSAYRLNLSNNPIRLFMTLFGAKLFRDIYSRTLSAIDTLGFLETYEESIIHSKPIILHLIKPQKRETLATDNTKNTEVTNAEII